MRVAAYLSGLALAALTAPASAAYTFLISTPIDGVTTTQHFESGCPGIGLCSTTTTFGTAFFFGTLDPNIEVLDGTYQLGSFSLASRIGVHVTLSFLDGSLQSSSLTGFSDFLRGSCPGFCNILHTDYTAANFALTQINTVTGETRIVAPVPEPASWALMLLGFSAMGYALRLRRPAKTRPT